MKTVFQDPQQVAHLWANQLQQSAKNSRHNFYFDGDTIYSYGRHFPIAKHLNGKVLFTLRAYSVTTSSHISMVRSACSHLPKIYCYDVDGTNSAHRENFERWESEVKSNIGKLKTARKPALYVSAIENIISQVNEYCKFFKLKLTKEQKEIFTLKDVANYKQLLADQQRKKELFEKHILTVGKKLADQYAHAWHIYAEKNFRDEATKRQKDLLTRYYQLSDTNTTWLRSNGETVETSKGIKLPVAVAKRYYKWYLQIAENGGCFNGDCNYKILDYAVRQASEDGLSVGCHTIDRTEINMLAEKLGW